MSSSGQDSRPRPKLAIIGGSGMCSLPDLKEEYRTVPQTKYGSPSDSIVVGEYQGQLVAFLPRHGTEHHLPPHKVPYGANLAALKEIGVNYVIGTCIVGSLKREIVPGQLVIPNQFVNLTWGRDNDYLPGEKVVHLRMAEPYCQQLRELLATAAEQAGETVLTKSTVAVIQGPRFSTQAESAWFSSNGWDIVNMTQYPECYFARASGLCYAAIAAVTDYDVGLQEDLSFNSENFDPILRVFHDNIARTKNLLASFVRQQYSQLSCHCAKSATAAYFEQAPQTSSG